MDWLLGTSGMLDETQELATAVIVALGTDRLATSTDVLPSLDSNDRRGWWGDLDAEEIWDGWPIGSRLWLLSRAKITDRGAREGATLARAENYVHEALQPFISRRIATAKTVEATRVGQGRIDVKAVIFRGERPAIELRFETLWANIGV